MASLDLGADYPNPLTDDVLAAADVVVSMDCGDACAIYPGKRYLDRTLDDPQGSNSRDGPLHPRRPGHQGPKFVARVDHSRSCLSPICFLSLLTKGSHFTSITPSELFVCVHNAGRSQMAAGFLSRLARRCDEGPLRRKRPHRQLKSDAVEAMAEVGIDTRRKHRKSSPPMPCKPQMW